ncbi:putative acyl-CoA dehydrogenase FadE [Nocardioides phosphati]|uniref:Acyl-CoA dehydrogenase FadE n=1 Tax=Nocardioides phosphati TaxID=1867775 RepID=A0ABQ2NCG6_9ACTN|nr:acyl-CoA dehydrogenase family protein [Nocardioides phosphati]GGO92706.1 putative acyl-CoA dehydrogenase FadE [Nocardioides phosphati]
MHEWSDMDEAIREGVRDWIAKNAEPQRDAIETGEIPPYDMARQFFADFGVTDMARDAIRKMLASERKRAERTPEEREAAKAARAEKKKDGAAEPNPMLDMLGMGAVVGSELAGVSLGTMVSVGVSIGLGAATILQKGTLEQKEKYVEKIATLEHIAAWSITEPDSGSDAFGGMKTTVRRDGDAFILTGSKTFATNGPDADVAVVYAKLDEGDGTPIRDRQVLAFILEKGDPGFTQGKPFKKMGLMSSRTGELFFDDVRLGMDRLLGGEKALEKGSSANDGRQSARDGFVMERVACAIGSLGIINECHRRSVDYAKKRELWGKPISDFQLIQLKLAKMEVARLNVQNMVFVALDGIKAGKMPTLAEASAMKLYSTEAATDVAMEAVQLFGGNGYMAEYRVEQLARDAKSLMIYAGSNEIQVTHVAKGLLAG